MTKLKCIVCELSNNLTEIAYIYQGDSYCQDHYYERRFCKEKNNPVMEHVFSVGAKDTCEYCGYVLNALHRRSKK